MLERQLGGTHRKAAPVPLVVWFEQLGRGDVPLVGGKNASLGEMVCHLASEGVKVPAGFATTADAYWQFIEFNDLREVTSRLLGELGSGKASLAETGSAIRRAFRRGAWPPDLADSIASSYQELCRRSGKSDADVAVRRALPRRICPTRASPVSRNPSSIFAARTRCSMLAGAAMHRSSPIGPSPTGRPRASIISRSLFRSAFR